MKKFALLYAAVFAVVFSQMALNALIAPIARELDMAEWQAGAMLSASALVVVLISGYWGRTSQRLGRKPVLVLGLLGAALSYAVFAGLVALGLREVLVGSTLVASLIVVRGILFGIAYAAIPPTAQAYVADATDTEAERVAGMSGIGAAQGMAMVVGSAVGGLLGIFGLIVPLIVLPIVLAAAALLLALRLPRQEAHELIRKPSKVRVGDPRVWPFLLVGLGAFTSLGFIQVLTGFLVVDRGGYSPQISASITGGVLLLAGVGMLLAQGAIVPKSGWGVGTLLRVGPVVAGIGLALIMLDLPLAFLGLGTLLTAMGLGIVIPAYQAGPTLVMRREELGGVAGLLAATMAGSFVLAPVLGTVLYGIWPIVPLLAAVVTMALVWIFVLLHPAFRRIPDVPVDEVDEVRAEVAEEVAEQNDAV